jgi:hypothetical protein
VAPMFTGMKKHFMIHIHWISIQFFLFLFGLLLSFIPIQWYCYIYQQANFIFLVLIIMSGLFARTSLSVCTPWFHSNVISSCWHTGLGMFSVVSMPNVLHIE